MHDRNDAFGKVSRQLDDIRMGHFYPTPGGKQCGNHEGILLGNHAAEFSDDAGRHAHLQPDGIDMAAARAATGGYHHFVPLAVCNDLFQNGGQGLNTPVTDGLTADFYHGHIRIKPPLRSGFQTVNKCFTHQAFTHESTLHMQPFAVFVSH